MVRSRGFGFHSQNGNSHSSGHSSNSQLRHPYVNGPEHPEHPGYADHLRRNRDQKLQWVWPKDRDQNGGHIGYWGRWRDVLTHKGPGIWIAKQNTTAPSRDVWSGWKGFGRPDGEREIGPLLSWERNPPQGQAAGGRGKEKFELVPVRSAADQDLRNVEYEMVPQTGGGDGNRGKVYDFNKRKYCDLQAGVFSDIRWSEAKPKWWVYHRDYMARPEVNRDVDGGAFQAGMGPNPFARRDRPRRPYRIRNRHRYLVGEEEHDD